jgi:hypothetical protein
MSFIEWFEAEHEPEDGLISFQDWLKARCGEADALLDCRARTSSERIQLLTITKGLLRGFASRLK